MKTLNLFNFNFEFKRPKKGRPGTALLKFKKSHMTNLFHPENFIAGSAGCYTAMYYLDENHKLKISLIAGVLSAAIISLTDESTNTPFMLNQRSSTENTLPFAFALGVNVGLAVSDSNIFGDDDEDAGGDSGGGGGDSGGGDDGGGDDGGGGGDVLEALVTGYYTGTITFFNSDTSSTVSLTAPDSNNHAFIAKINADGIWVWAVNAGSVGASQIGWRITALNDNSALITGFYSTAMTFNSTVTLKSPVGNSDVFIAKIDTNGNWIWAVDAGSGGSDYGVGITAMPDNSALIIGTYNGPMTFFNSNTTVSTLTLKNPVNSSVDVFIAKIDSNGSWVWAADAGSTSTDQGFIITAMGDNTALVSGVYSAAMTFFNSNGIASAVSLNAPVGITDIFIAKISDAGNWIWAVDVGDVTVINGGAYGMNITALADNGALVVGAYTAAMTFNTSSVNLKPPVSAVDVFIAKIDVNGNWVWAVDAGSISSSTNNGASITALADGTALVTGNYIGSMIFFNSNTMVSTLTLKTPVNGSYDVFIAKIDTNGNWIWAVDAGSNLADGGVNITAFSDNTALVTGYYTGSMTFFNSNTTVSTLTLKTPVGGIDAFLAKIDGNGNWIWAVDAGSSSTDAGWSIAALN